MDIGFDLAASNYDSQFSHTLVGRAQRMVVWEYLDAHFKEPAKVLELNCGTGEDAVHLASKGHMIIATDQSKEMLQVTKRKAHDKGSMQSLITLPLDLNTPEKFELHSPVDLIFSNFGGLNCINAQSLEVLAKSCFDWLTPNGQLIMVVMPRHTILDKWYRMKKGQWSKIKNRKEGRDMVNVEGTQFETFYYNYQELKSAFNQFSVVSMLSIGLIPSYLEPFMERHPKLLNYIQQKETRIRKKESWINRSDHYLLHLKK